MKVEITLKDKRAGRIEITRWVRSNSKLNMSLKDALHVADSLLRGETWKTQIDLLLDGFKERNFIFNIQSIAEESEDTHFQVQEKYWDLCRRGAEGDAVAAIEFCKLEMAGQIRHGAFA